MAKDHMCCGRLKGRLVHEEGNLAKLARQASRRAGKGLLVDEAHKLEIANAKNAVTEARKLLEEHGAEHVDEVA